MAHELGHAHGRKHAPCGSAPDADPGFPRGDGAIGVWGWDQRSPKAIIPPAIKDVMSYCGQRWISDYTFQALAERSTLVNQPRAAVAGAALTATPEVSAGRVLLVAPDGSARWGLPAHGEPPSGEPVTALVRDAAGTVIEALAAHELEIADGPDRAFWVPEPRAAGSSVELPGIAAAVDAALAAPR
jgi:hypothetical protein